MTKQAPAMTDNAPSRSLWKDRWVRTGAAATLIALLGCLAPHVVVLLGIVGAVAWLATLEHALFAGVVLFSALTGYAVVRHRRGACAHDAAGFRNDAAVSGSERPQMKRLLRLLGGLTLLGMAVGVHAGKLPRLTLAGPYAAVSFPLIHMVESGALKDLAEQVEFVAWRNPDQLRVLALEGRADFVAMPSNVAANLYNRGVKLQLLNISTWGVLWLVSRDPNLKTLADFKGKEILMPFRADMPDIVFQTLAEKQGLDPKRDFRLRYVASPLDAMQLLITRRADHALLSEPAVSVALRKTQSFPISVIAPDLHRSADLQQEWGRLMQRPARIPQAGVVAMGRALGDAALIEKFQQAYAASLAWCEKNPDECGKQVAKRADLLTPEGVADSVRVDNAVFVTAKDAKPELEFFFGQLLARQPALVGGKLPDAGFYYDGLR